MHCFRQHTALVQQHTCNVRAACESECVLRTCWEQLLPSCQPTAAVTTRAEYPHCFVPAGDKAAVDAQRALHLKVAGECTVGLLLCQGCCRCRLALGVEPVP